MKIIPDALKIKKRKFSPVWITPILALIITLWIVYSGFIDSGKEITIQFDSGSNIIEGKTLLKYRGLTIGKVVRFDITDSLDKIDVIIRLKKEAERVATEGVKFWIVKPRLGLNQITGLETIISGTYIEMRPPSYDKKELMNLKEQDRFIGLSEPPVDMFLNNAFPVNLISEKDPSLYSGMRVYHNGIDAGQVMSVKYDEKAKLYRIVTGILKKYKKHFNSKTKFWNVSKFDLKYDSAGFHFQLDSLNSIFQGGIAFNSSKNKQENKVKEEFILHANYMETLLSPRKILIHMPESYGVRPSRTPVMFKGLQVGLVTDLKLSTDKTEILTTLRMNTKYEYLVKERSRFFIGRPVVSASEVKNLSSLVTGVFISLEAGEGKMVSEFYLSEDSPIQTPKGSANITINAKEKGSLGRGSGIYYKGVKVGVIKNHKLQGDGLKFFAIIYPKYRNLASSELFLWESESVDIKFDEKGLNVKTAKISSILEGGVTAGFFSKNKGTLLKKNKELKLYSNKGSAKQAFIATRGIKKITMITDDASGIYNGAPVMYRGIKIGELGTHSLNKKSGIIRIIATIEKEYRYLIKDNAYFWKLGTASVNIGTDGLSIMTPGIKELIKGGVAFDYSKTNLTDNGSYILYSDKKSAKKAEKIASVGKIIKLYFSEIKPPDEGIPIFYKGMRSGETSKVGYDQKKKMSYINVLIDSDYTKTITNSTRFWMNSEVHVQTNGAGFSAKIEPVINYIKGSLNYENFLSSKGSDRLYKNRLSAEKPDYKRATVKLKHGHSLKKLAPVMSRDQKIGYVENIEYRNGKPQANILIKSKFSGYLTKGAVFWSENLIVSFDGVKNTDSILFGSKIMMLPGNGPLLTEFTALSEPASVYRNAPGLHIVLTAPTRSSLEVGSPVYYRQIPTGAVEWIKLSDIGDEVEIGIYVQEKFSHLVRSNSVFVSVSGIDASYGLVSGFKLKTDSLKAILKGGISFTTEKKNTASDSKNGDVFKLTGL
ncbi:MAG: MCE family protein [Desulfobacterales bacterium]|nr:MCE family protein [Desulfobacterales bacterium]MCP4162616.1 MCE family protein [Deltaproteobacteria bacterium]